MRVAVAVITDSEKRILITQRSQTTSHPGFWEFPGGKSEPLESPAATLVREIREEVGLDVIRYEYMGEIQHQYDDKAVSLFVFHVNSFHGNAACLESQTDLRWIHPNQLSEFSFPEANHKIIEMLPRALLEQ